VLHEHEAVQTGEWKLVGDIIIANVIASAFLMVMIYFFDINEKEPPWTLVRIYAVSIILTFIYGNLFAVIFKPGQMMYGTWFTHFVLAGFCEEFWKFLVVLIFVWPLKSFNEETDGIVYYLIVAAGFTVLENVGYSFHFVLNPFILGMKTGEMGFYHRAVTQIVLLRWVSGHIFVNVISGVFLGLAKKRKKTVLLIPGFFISVILHGCWNLSAVSGYLLPYTIFLLAGDIWAFVWTVKQSIYYRSMKRLRLRMKDLIAEGVKMRLPDDLVVLMRSVYSGLGAIGRMQGEEIVQQVKSINELLPPGLKESPLEGDDGLIRRYVKIFGILGRDRQSALGEFWFGLYLKFVLTGFFLLTVIMRIRLAGP
jgi:RsiW-degrading membrane proteinase PrsW (M82 family)